MAPSTKQRSLQSWSRMVASGFVLLVSYSPVLIAQEAQRQKPPTTLEVPGGLEALLRIEIPVVSAASGFAQPATAAPSSISVITVKDIKLYGYRTLADILQSVRGFHVSYDRNYSFLGVRGFNSGFDNSRVLVLVDGHRMNSILNDSATIGTEFLLDVDLIEEVQVIRGPGSVLYGNNAFFGVINVITRRANDFSGYGAEVSGEVASFETYKGRVTYGHRFTNGLALVMSGTLYDSAGDDRLFYNEFKNTPSHGIARDLDDDRFKSFFGSLAFRDFTLEGGFITREKENPTAPDFTTFNDPRTRFVDDRGYAELKFVHEFANDVGLIARVYYDGTSREKDYPFEVLFGGPGQVYKEQQHGDWWGAEVKAQKSLTDRLTFILGAEYRDAFRSDRRAVFVAPPPFNFVEHDSETRQDYGFFLQGDLTILTNLHLSAGARYDKYGELDRANPRLALIYNPWAKSAVKAIYGSAFRAPTFIEQAVSLQPLKPETITTYELVYEQGIGDHLQAFASAFYNQMDDFVRLDPAAAGYFNSKGGEARGLELELEGRWSAGIRTRLSYAFQETEDSETGKRFNDSPEHLAKLNLSVPVWREKLFAGLEFQYTSRRTTLRNLGNGLVEAGNDASGFGVVNFTLFSQNLIKGLDASVSVYNLLDERYSDPATFGHQQDRIERDGRTFRFKLTYRF